MPLRPKISHGAPLLEGSAAPSVSGPRAEG
jgi:hypothetical protein